MDICLSLARHRIGVGIVIQGQPYRGAHIAAGELGDLVVGRQFLGQPRDGQGNLAQLIGGKSLRRRARQATGAKLSAAEALIFAEEETNWPRWRTRWPTTWPWP